MKYGLDRVHSSMHCVKGILDEGNNTHIRGCSSVGRVVASNSRGLQFKSSHQQKIILNIYCQLYGKDENKEKEAGNGPYLKTISSHIMLIIISIYFSSHYLLRLIHTIQKNACGCGRQLGCEKIENFVSLRKRNCLPQVHAESQQILQPSEWAFRYLVIMVIVERSFLNIAPT